MADGQDAYLSPMPGEPMGGLVVRIDQVALRHSPTLKYLRLRNGDFQLWYGI